MLLSTACSLTSRFNTIVAIVGVVCSVSYQNCATFVFAQRLF